MTICRRFGVIILCRNVGPNLVGCRGMGDSVGAGLSDENRPRSLQPPRLQEFDLGHNSAFWPIWRKIESNLKKNGATLLIIFLQWSIAFGRKQAFL
jgi:hypothetical protein